MTIRREAWLWASGAALLAAAAACSASGEDDAGTNSAGSGQGAGNGQGGTLFTTGTGNSTTGTLGTGGNTGDCSEAAKLIYLVSVEHDLYSFNPTIAGAQAYKHIGQLSCPSSGDPQSMSVDRSGTAWVFYHTGELFRVSTADASCEATTYQHPVNQAFSQLGMGFTAAAPDSTDQRLFIISPDFGLATIELPSLAVTQTGALVVAAELTGGPDARLFQFIAEDGDLNEIDLTSNATSFIHHFPELEGTLAFAFARYAGEFYVFTAPGVGSTTTHYDPVTDQSMFRDSLDFTVVGAGQSTCVPPPTPQ
jgi:hypothetical protein